MSLSLLDISFKAHYYVISKCERENYTRLVKMKLKAIISEKFEEV